MSEQAGVSPERTLLPDARPEEGLVGAAGRAAGSDETAFAAAADGSLTSTPAEGLNENFDSGRVWGSLLVTSGGTGGDWVPDYYRVSQPRRGEPNARVLIASTAA